MGDFDNAQPGLQTKTNPIHLVSVPCILRGKCGGIAGIERSLLDQMAMDCLGYLQQPLDRQLGSVQYVSVKHWSRAQGIRPGHPKGNVLRRLRVNGIRRCQQVLRGERDGIERLTVPSVLYRYSVGGGSSNGHPLDRMDMERFCYGER